jgi:hypothetical protein
LSVICGALRWLKDNEDVALDDNNNNNNDNDNNSESKEAIDPNDWVAEQTRARQLAQRAERRRRRSEARARERSRLAELRSSQQLQQQQQQRFAPIIIFLCQCFFLRAI